jgi:hypothetical protein
MRDEKLKHRDVHERPTADLCGDQRFGGSCIRERGHTGKHLGPNWREDKLVTWD